MRGDGGETVGTVSELWRYPVKSLQGERISRTACTERGVEFDRSWCVKGADGKAGSGKTTRRFRRMPGLLTMASLVDESGTAKIRFPDGSVGGVGDGATASRVSDIVGEPVELAQEQEVSHLDDAPIHLLTTASIRWLRDLLPEEAIDSRRFRPNLVIDSALPSESLIGAALHIGDAVLRVDKATVRCVMTTQPQADLGFAPSILSTLERQSDSSLGVYARVEVPGRFALSDAVTRRSD